MPPFLLRITPFARGTVFAHSVCLGNFDYLLAASVETLAVLCLVVALGLGSRADVYILNL